MESSTGNGSASGGSVTPNIESLEDDTIVQIVETLCFCPWYGEHGYSKRYKKDVFPFLLAFPLLYKRIKQTERFKWMMACVMEDYYEWQRQDRDDELGGYIRDELGGYIR